MRIAVVHDWLDTWAGSEQALTHILALFPDATLFALVDFLSPEHRARIPVEHIHTTFIQHLPWARRAFRRYLPWFPLAIERLDLSRFDLVISSSHAVAKGARTRPDQLHICYCYTPMRYAWDLQEQYLEQVGLNRGVTGWITRRSLARLAAWDRRCSTRVQSFVAISRHIARRIERCYGRDAAVIHPPVTLAPMPAAATRGGAYVTVSRLVPYKRIDRIIEAFRRLPDRELLVIGEGPERARLKACAGGNVRLLGQLSDAERDRRLAEARAFVFAAEEDFGIAPLEAQAVGTPVIAYRQGGSAETIVGLDHSEPTGVLFEEQTAESIAAAIIAFESAAHRIRPEACRANAERFAPGRFSEAFREHVEARWREFVRDKADPRQTALLEGTHNRAPAGAPMTGRGDCGGRR